MVCSLHLKKFELHITLNKQPLFKLNIDHLLMQITLSRVEHTITVIAFTNDVSIPKPFGKGFFPSTYINLKIQGSIETKGLFTPQAPCDSSPSIQVGELPWEAGGGVGICPRFSRGCSWCGRSHLSGN